MNLYLSNLLEWDKTKLSVLLECPPLFQTYAAAILIQDGKKELVSTVFMYNPIVTKLISEITNFRFEHKISDLFPEFESKSKLEKLCYVNTPHKLTEIQGILNEPLIAFDCEWRPEGYGVPSIIQLVSMNYSVIIDIKLLYCNPLFQEFMLKLFTSPKIYKIGHAFINNDFECLNVAYGLPCFLEIINFADIDIINEKIFKGFRNKSLKSLTARFLHKSIDKEKQKSNWDKRPLSDKQIKYVITDSLAIFAIFEKMCTIVKDEILKAFTDYKSTKKLIEDRYALNPYKKDSTKS